VLAAGEKILGMRLSGTSCAGPSHGYQGTYEKPRVEFKPQSLVLVDCTFERRNQGSGTAQRKLGRGRLRGSQAGAR